MKKKLVFILSFVATASCMQGMEQKLQDYLDLAPYDQFTIGEYKRWLRKAVREATSFKAAGEIVTQENVEQIWPHFLKDEVVRKRLMELVEKEGNFPLFTCCWNAWMGDKYLLARLLIENGSEVNEKIVSKSLTGLLTQTPLTTSVQYKDMKIPFLLLLHGAKVDERCESFFLKFVTHTPLMIACEEGHTETVELLLKYGANPLLKNHEEKRPYDLAANQEIKDLIVQAIKEREEKQTLASKNSKEEE